MNFDSSIGNNKMSEPMDNVKPERNERNEQNEHEKQHEKQHSTEPIKETTQELIEETTNVLEKLKEVTTSSQKPNENQSKEFRRSVKNPFKNLTPRVCQLIYWENPAHSGAILAIGLSLLIFTTYYSLFNTFCALSTILLGVNWAYVIGRKQLESLFNQKPVNPYEYASSIRNSMVNNPWYIEREEAEKYLDTTVEALNFVLLEAQKVILVDDPMRTVRHIISFYVLWTLGAWFNIRTLFGIALILGFVTPITYQKNQVLIDEKLDHLREFLHSHFDRSIDIAKQHTGGVIEKAKLLAAKKGLLNNQDTKKEE